MEAEKKHVLVIGLVLLAIGGVFGLPYINWLRLELELRDEMGDKKLGRFATAADLAAFPAKAARLAKDKGFATATMKPRLVNRSVGPVRWWFFELHVSSGQHTLFVQRRIESKFGRGDLEALEEEGFEVVRSSE
ncbi:MAG TPA: hypothetical protein DEA08_36110 [Planctomycetes bacterium]|nr:hypothetical protein [Planctomycetota bacterium]